MEAVAGSWLTKQGPQHISSPWGGLRMTELELAALGLYYKMVGFSCEYCQAYIILFTQISSVRVWDCPVQYTTRVGSISSCKSEPQVANGNHSMNTPQDLNKIHWMLFLKDFICVKNRLEQ